VILNGACPEGVGTAVPDQEQTPAPSSTEPPSPPEPAPDPALRPTWISVERWDILPAMLRAVLIGATLIDGSVHAASPYLDRLLRTRCAREVAELVAAAHDAQRPVAADAS